MQSKSPPKVFFYRVKDNSAKIKIISTKAHEAFQIEKRLLIAVPSFEAAQYVDSLLWRTPQESFLPHVISDTKTKEWIAITMQDKENINQSAHLFNLTSTVSPLAQTVEEIFEFYDETHPQKKELSDKRVSEYRARECPIVILECA